MCGRFVMELTPELIREVFGVTASTPPPPSYNIAPTQLVLVVRQVSDRNRLDLLKWGLVPPWAKDPAIGSQLINARSETVAVKPSFRHAIRYHRCIVPASGFFDWKHEGKAKTPYYFRMKDGSPLGLASIWEDPTIAAAETMEQAFWHELIHFITFMMSEDELRNNEKFVDIAAHFLHQAVKTSTGEWADYGKGGETSLESNPKQLASEPLVPLSAGLLEYACWLQQRIAALQQDGGCGKQACREIRALLDGEVARLERELARLMVG